MPTENEPNAARPASRPARLPYKKPTVTRVDLSLEETLATGCKETIEACVAPPFQNFSDTGS
jgi:hypothetical protein